MSNLLLQPGRWCTRCGGRPGIAGPAWICRVCVAGGPHQRIPIHNPGRRPRPPGVPRARERYRDSGRCHGCGLRRDTEYLHCSTCKRLHAAATSRWRRLHGPSPAVARAAARLREQRHRAAGLCVCGRQPDPGRKNCARCLRSNRIDRCATGRSSAGRLCYCSLLFRPKRETAQATTWAAPVLECSRRRCGGHRG